MTKINSLEPPKLATWLLEQFLPVLQNTPLAGDLMESFKQGRSSGWYWRQVFWAIVIGLLNFFRKRCGRLRVASLMESVRTSKPKFVTSLTIALAALVAGGWWAVNTLWLTSPSTNSMPIIRYEGDGDGCLGCPLVLVGEYFDGTRQITEPAPLSWPLPVYTPLAIKNKVAGAVVALVEVDPRGSVADVKLTRVDLSSNVNAGLEQGVIDAVRTWKFKPATEKSKPVPANVHVQVTFSFNSL